jgi:RimJ/RimL family protein N-acetyltransferase
MTGPMPGLIELPGLTLRRAGPQDAGMLAEAVTANLDHLRDWMPWADPAAGTVQVQAARLAGSGQEWDQGSTYEFVAVLGEPARLLGAFGLHRRIGPGGLELGYWLSRDATGQGHATAAARALTAAALALPDVDRVEIHCDPANERSRRLPQRLGYRLDRVDPRQPDAPAETGLSEVWIYP